MYNVQIRNTRMYNKIHWTGCLEINDQRCLRALKSRCSLFSSGNSISSYSFWTISLYHQRNWAKMNMTHTIWLILHDSYYMTNPKLCNYFTLFRDCLNWNRRNQRTWNETNKITDCRSSYKEKFKPLSTDLSAWTYAQFTV